MATPFHCTQSFAAPPERLWELLSDPDYIQDKGMRSAAAEVWPEVRTEGGETVIINRRRMVLPASFPGVLKKFTGDSLMLNETDRWLAVDGEGIRRGTFVLDFGGHPMAFRGDLVLRPAAAGSEVVTDGTIKASVPLIGGKAESVAAHWIERFLRKEEEVAGDWLSR
jgi:hypothetical protein